MQKPLGPLKTVSNEPKSPIPSIHIFYVRGRKTPLKFSWRHPTSVMMKQFKEFDLKQWLWIMSQWNSRNCDNHDLKLILSPSYKSQLIKNGRAAFHNLQHKRVCNTSVWSVFAKYVSAADQISVSSYDIEYEIPLISQTWSIVFLKHGQ